MQAKEFTSDAQSFQLFGVNCHESNDHSFVKEKENSLLYQSTVPSSITVRKNRRRNSIDISPIRTPEKHIIPKMQSLSPTTSLSPPLLSGGGSSTSPCSSSFSFLEQDNDILSSSQQQRFLEDDEISPSIGSGMINDSRGEEEVDSNKNSIDDSHDTNSCRSNSDDSVVDLTAKLSISEGMQLPLSSLLSPATISHRISNEAIFFSPPVIALANSARKSSKHIVGKAGVISCVNDLDSDDVNNCSPMSANDGSSRHTILTTPKVTKVPPKTPQSKFKVVDLVSDDDISESDPESSSGDITASSSTVVPKVNTNIGTKNKIKNEEMFHDSGSDGEGSDDSNSDEEDDGLQLNVNHTIYIYTLLLLNNLFM